jgi:inner membrane protein
MPTTLTHALVGVTIGHELMRKPMPARFWVASVVCPLIPDADVIGFRFGIAYVDFFGHRGFFHSPFFALLVSLFVVCVFFRDRKILTKPWWLAVGYFFLITATHGILDAFTNGGLGIALLSPVDTTRYFFPWRPIAVSPIGIEYFFSPWGISALTSEVKYVWLPLALFCLALRIIGGRYAGQKVGHSPNTPDSSSPDHAETDA